MPRFRTVQIPTDDEFDVRASPLPDAPDRPNDQGPQDTHDARAKIDHLELTVTLIRTFNALDLFIDRSGRLVRRIEQVVLRLIAFLWLVEKLGWALGVSS